jgi:hypothetical protein
LTLLGLLFNVSVIFGPAQRAIKNMKILCTIALVAAAASLSANTAKIESLKKEFSTVRALELPARAASTVAAAKQADRQELAGDVVRAALDVKASSAPLLVGAIARSTPEVAASSAVTAASIQPKETARITRAAVGAAPSEAEAIVSALTKEHPTAFAVVAISAVDVAPKSAQAILRGVTSANPTLKSLIGRIDTKGAKTAPEVVTVLKRVDALVAKLSRSSNTTSENVLANELTPAMMAQLPGMTATVMASAPIIGPPYTPGGGAGETDTSQSYPAGDRQPPYSSP